MNENKINKNNSQENLGLLFRTAVNGFNRKDVISYIADLVREKKTEKEDAETRLNELKREHDKMILSLMSEYRVVSKDLEAANELVQELSEQLERSKRCESALEYDIAVLKAVLKDRDSRDDLKKDRRIDALEKEADFSRKLYDSVNEEKEKLLQRLEKEEKEQTLSGKIPAADDPAQMAENEKLPSGDVISGPRQIVDENKNGISASERTAQQTVQTKVESSGTEPVKIYAGTRDVKDDSTKKKWADSILMKLITR